MNLQHLNLYNYRPLSTDKIEEIEKKIGIKLPPSYKSFISQYNKALFGNVSIFRIKDNRGYNASERLDGNGFSLMSFLDFDQIENEFVFENTDLNPKEFIPIIRADGSWFYFLCVKEGDNYGKIYFDYLYSDYDLETLYCVADSLEEFLDCIVDDETY